MSSQGEEIYNALIDAGFSEEYIQSKIQEKSHLYHGFISKPAILFLIAKEEGLSVQSPLVEEEFYNEFDHDEIDYNEFTIEIKEVKAGMRNFVVLGRIQTIFDIRAYTRKDTTPGRVGSFILNDNSDAIKIVLWDDRVKIMEDERFQPNELIRIINGYCKEGRRGNLEIHMGKKGIVKLAPNDIDHTKIPKIDDVLLKPYFQKQKSKSSSIKEVTQQEGYVRSVEGMINIEDFKEVNLRSGEKTFLLKLKLSDYDASIIILIWGMAAVNFLKKINDGDLVKITNLKGKFNDYTKQFELIFTSKSSFVTIH